jgi:hypothetical protein
MQQVNGVHKFDFESTSRFCILLRQINQKMFYYNSSVMKKTTCIIGLLFPVLLFAQVDLDDDVVAWFPFNGNAIDQTGNGNDGNVIGATLTTDRFGVENAAYFFNGIDNLITIDDNPQLRLSSLSLLLWVSFYDIPTNQRNLISKPVGIWNSDSYVFWYQYDGMSGHIGNVEGAGLFSHCNWIPELEQWYFMAFTYDENSQIQTIYINGEEMVSEYTEPLIGWDEHPVMIGAESDTEQLMYWHFGKIDDILIYNRALNAQEISALYEHYYGLDEMADRQGINAKIYPNPCSDMVHLKVKTEEGLTMKCTLYSPDGQVVGRYDNYFSTQDGMEMEMDVSGLTSGIYFLNIIAGDRSGDFKLSVVNN